MIRSLIDPGAGLGRKDSPPTVMHISVFVCALIYVTVVVVDGAIRDDHPQGAAKTAARRLLLHAKLAAIGVSSSDSKILPVFEYKITALMGISLAAQKGIYSKPWEMYITGSHHYRASTYATDTARTP